MPAVLVPLNYKYTFLYSIIINFGKHGYIQDTLKPHFNDQVKATFHSERIAQRVLRRQLEYLYRILQCDALIKC